MARLDIWYSAGWVKVAENGSFHVRLVARAMKVSQRTLQRYTQAAFGRSPQKWLDELRQMLAPEKLKEKRQVKAACYALGYKHMSHFSRSFKLWHGVSPTAYLAQADGMARKAGNGNGSGHFRLSIPGNKCPRHITANG